MRQLTFSCWIETGWAESGPAPRPHRSAVRRDARDGRRTRPSDRLVVRRRTTGETPAEGSISSRPQPAPPRNPSRYHFVPRLAPRCWGDSARDRAGDRMCELHAPARDTASRLSGDEPGRPGLRRLHAVGLRRDAPLPLHRPIDDPRGERRRLFTPGRSRWAHPPGRGPAASPPL
jgi:hypothetical protein